MTAQKAKRKWKKPTGKSQVRNPRIRFLYFSMVVFAALIIARLFVLQVSDHEFYEALASGQHELFQELFPERGEIYFQDEKEKSPIVVATNQQLAFVYADPRKIEDAEKAAEAIGYVFGYDEEQTKALEERLGNHNDPYEPIAHGVSDEQLEQLLAIENSGLDYVYEPSRFYPEGNIGGHVIGFIGSDEIGEMSGKYGAEGYFNDLLTGTPGFLRSERDISGRIIAMGDRSFQPAVDGADVVLTIDRTVQYIVCSKLEEAVKRFDADSGSVVIVDPTNGRIISMCGYPDFDPNNYREVERIEQYNNPTIFDAYEPGSIFKPITIAAALDSGAVTPMTTYVDNGEVKIDVYTIKNSDEKAHGTQTMTQALEESLNTGMIFAMRETGRETFGDYVRAFGFGEYTGIDLDTELPGTVVSLRNPSEINEIYFATASYGQGIMVTPLQIALAYAAIANGGTLLRPQVVDEIRYSDGTVEKYSGGEVRRVISEKTARQLSAMLISVVEHGHGEMAAVPGYYIAGKTGTAQVAASNGIGYQSGNLIASFAGFGPVNNPKFSMIVRIDHPRNGIWGASTAAPLFGEIADFLLRYYEVPKER